MLLVALPWNHMYDVCLQLVLAQLSRPEERRCPLGKASNEVVELLSVHWNIFAPGCSSKYQCVSLLY